MGRRAPQHRHPCGAILLGLVLWTAGCAPRLSGDALIYDSGVVIADADQSNPDASSSGDGGPGDGEALDGALPDATPGRVPNWNDDIQPIMARHCNTCHGATPAGGATFGLSTYAQVLGEMVSARSQETDYRYVFMARAVASMVAPMPPEFVMNPMSADDVAAMVAWAAAGAPEDVSDTDGGTAPPDARVAAPEDGGLPDAPTFPDAAVFPDAAPPPVNPLTGAGTVDQVAGGLVFTEGPLWVPGLDVLLFSDVGASRMHRVTPPNALDVFREPSAVANGLALDPTGRLVIAEHESRSVTRMSTAGGSVTEIVSNYRGLRFNSPNDVTVRSDGVMYFTDPPYGLGMRTREIPFNGLFRFVEQVPTSTVVAEWEGALTTAPNGVVLRADERVLYMADTTGNLIMAFDVAVADGDLSNPRVHVRTANGPDGMAIDANDNLFVATAMGIQAYAPDGLLWGTIAVPRTPSNIAWGDADRRTLYITAVSQVYRVRLVTPGVRD